MGTVHPMPEITDTVRKDEAAPDRVELVTETMILPTGCPLESRDVRHFAVYVRWRGVRTDTGMGGWAVTSSFVDEQLSRAGNWNDMVPRFKTPQYRFDTREAALAAAHAAVDARTVNGRTYAQARQWRAEQEQARAAETA